VALPRVQIDVLGPLAATVDGELVNLGGRRQRAVLAVLLLARGHLVSADALVEAVWSHALQAYVSHLRRALEPGRAARTRGGIIVSDGPACALRLDPDAVDMWGFEGLIRESDTLTDPFVANHKVPRLYENGKPSA
jgi:DNA-binding SARP family transcriptional activator